MARIETLQILDPGPLTTVQDLGRFGLARYGVPPSGALDTFSLRAGNRLAGNREGEAALEITFLGPKVVALTDALIAVTGADLQPMINHAPISMWRSQPVRKGDILSFKGPRSGCRAYLAVGGGICVTEVMGSKSTNLAAGFGGFEGRPLKKGDILLADSPGRYLGGAVKALEKDRIPVYPRQQTVRVIFGPQDDHFSEKAREIFTRSTFKVTPRSDRAGIRLSGPPIEARGGLKESIISEGVVPGAVQIPGDAQPIIILGETVTGGYRKIATVVSADLPLLGQLKPGDTLRFRRVTLHEACEALRAAPPAYHPARIC